MLAKEAATRLATTAATLKDVRLGLTEKTIDVLAGYRKHFLSQAHPPGQLVMPERLKEFSMYMLALIKTYERSREGTKPQTDARSRNAHDSIHGALELSLYLYPRMIPIPHNLQPEDGFPDEQTGH